MKKLARVNGLVFFVQLTAFALLVFSSIAYEGLDGLGLFLVSSVVLFFLCIPVVIMGVLLALQHAKPFAVHIPLILNGVLIGFILIRLIFGLLPPVV